MNINVKKLFVLLLVLGSATQAFMPPKPERKSSFRGSKAPKLERKSSFKDSKAPVSGEQQLSWRDKFGKADKKNDRRTDFGRARMINPRS
jgi:hypothetical protein